MANLTVSTDVDNFMQSADNAAARASLQVPSTDIQILAGFGLTGGGDLNADRTLSVAFGTTSTTACVGNDARLSNTRTPSAHAISHGSGGTDQITSLALTTATITGTPSNPNDIVNKAYADAIASGVNFHDACDYSTITALSPSATYNQPGGAGVGVGATLTGSTNAPLQVDGTTVSVGQRILVKNQGSAFQNGIYTVTQQGDNSTVPYILTRATDYDTSGSNPNEVQAGDFVLVLSGTLANTAWVQQTPAPINFGVTSITFIQFAAANAGVTSFKTDLSGLTPSTNTTGAVTLSGTLGVAGGGTGTTTAQAAMNTFAGGVTSGQYLRGNGTNVVLSGIQAGDVPTLNQNTTGTAAGLSSTLAIASGGTGATSTETARIALGGVQQVDWSQTSTVTGTYNTGAGTLTYSANGTLSFDGATPSVGDTVYLSGQGTGSTPTGIANGPWVVTDVGSAGTPGVLTRPSWFSGTLQNAVVCAIKYGQNNAGAIRAAIGPVGTSKTGFTVGSSVITNVTISTRASNVPTSGATMTGRLTCVANSTTTSPLLFQASSGLLSSPQAHALEWDGSSMYLTTSAAVRNTSVMFPTSLAPTAGQWLTWDATNSRWAPNPSVLVDSSNSLVLTRSTGEAVIACVNTGTANAWLALTPGSAGIAYVHNSTATPMVFTTNGLERMRIDAIGNVYAASGATGMTSGFIWAAAASGAPTTAPTSAPSGRVPLYYDTAANKLYVYNGGWKASSVFA